MTKMDALLGRFAALALIVPLAAACTAADRRAPSLDAVAEQYVRLSLEIGAHEDGYIDAYYGPAQWKEEAEASPRSASALREAVRELLADLDPVRQAAGDGMDQRRASSLQAQLTAAETRLRMLLGEQLSFEEEARGLFGLAPDIHPLESYDTVLAEIDALLPGDEPLAQRVDAFENRFTIPVDRLQPVFDAAIAECRARTLVHIPLPENERFSLAFVTDQAWSGYNYFLGDAESKIEVNTDLPIRLSRALDLGCHEGYPGHHVYGTLIERDLVRGRGWVEFSVFPLFSPQALIAEGSANYGVDLAFPGEERLTFETRVLYPLAGLDPAEAERYDELQEAKKALAGVRFTIARDYLEGRLTREEAIAASERYQLVSRARAEQSLAFVDHYRSYVINYGLGEELVRNFIEAEGAAGPEARWEAMERILSEPTLPADLAPGLEG